MKRIIVLLIPVLLFSCTVRQERSRMVSLLEEARQQNSNYIPFTSDSTMKQVVRFYDRHGNTVEKMLAHYLLGCVYRDLGDATIALQCFQTAVDKADTASLACDTLLYKIHSQMASLFYEEYMPQQSLEEIRMAEHYAWMAKDTLAALLDRDLQANAYQQLRMNDSVIAIHARSIEAFKQHGYVREAYQSMGALIHALVQEDRLDEAGAMMLDYERNSGLFDSNGNIMHGKEIYYYAKGMRFIKTGQADSASLYFRKELSFGKTANDSLAAYTGLHMLYQSVHAADSALKYADLRIAKTNEVYEASSAESMYRMSAMHDYSRQQDIAHQKTMEAERTSFLLILALVLFLLVAFAILSLWKKREKIVRSRFETYQQTVNQLRQAEYEIKAIKEAEYRQLEKEKAEEINNLRLKIKEMETRDPAFLEKHLRTAAITCHFKEVAAGRSVLNYKDWQKLSAFMQHENPAFMQFLCSKSLREEELRLCMLVRLYFSNSQICNVCNLKPTHVSMMRKRLSVKVFGQELDTKAFDERIQIIS